ncbi:arf-GAP with Rho-GAP domain, ANK repeat and PH domain-containing protein 1-like, partial [Coturnix japonica]|uniref:arf-GAP with Rho-GAP domain, ANK repeat and PH domain-containing protein 1-like n=1 Tax=Coturnix japonica TaxID=93934 RepID=UPI000777F3B2
MALGSVRDGERRSFQLITPYGSFSFVAPSHTSKQSWLCALQAAVSSSLSHYGAAERVWGQESNRSCADCGAPQPTWASINLCVVICDKCAGEHRALGPNVSKVRSLRMDRKVWTEEMLQLLCALPNSVSNRFWAAQVPPTESISAMSHSADRGRHITYKYRHGRYRRYHPMYGDQMELNRALCMAVTTSDVAETQSLLFCGADVSCPTGDPQCPTPLMLAQRSGQSLQAEILQHNLNTVPPSPDFGVNMADPYSVLPPIVTHSGFLYKTPSMGKPHSDRRGVEDFSRRWVSLQDGLLSYYESERHPAPNGEIRMNDVVCLVNNPPHSHGLPFTFELYLDSERLYLFGLNDPNEAQQWLRSIAKSLVPPCPDHLLTHNFDRLGKLHYKGGLNLEPPKLAWFALVGHTLWVCPIDGQEQEAVQLRKLQELTIQGDNEVLVLVERRRTLYIHGERRLDFVGWLQAIQGAAGSGGDTLEEQQLTEGDVPVL